MAQLTSIVRYLNELLTPSRYDDVALNGLQVESPSSEVTKVAVAVDSGLSVVEKAAQAGAGLLLVHHGLFWGKAEPITGAMGKKIAALLQGGCSLYASHLPLDAHREVGNGYELARFLGLTDLMDFCEYHGTPIGARGRFAAPTTLENVVHTLSALSGAPKPLVLPFGKDSISSVGIVTGSGAFGVRQAAEAGLDLYVSGEPKHEVYHATKELGINAIFAGHYATETFGVRALARKLEKDFDLSTVFIDETSGI